MSDPRLQSRQFLMAAGVAVFVVFVTRALAFPHSWWLRVEPLLGVAIGNPDPLAGHPPAPGFPLYLQLARMLMFKAETPFVALVVAAFLSSVAATALIAAAFWRMSRDAVAGALAALLLFMAPAMLVFSSTPAPEASALMFFAIALNAAAKLLTDEAQSWRTAALLGAGVAGTVGCQPEWTLPALLLLLAPLFAPAARRLLPIAVLTFVAGTALVFASLSNALGGPVALLRWTGLAASGGAGTEGVASSALLDAFGPPWLAIPVTLLALAGIAAAIRARESLLLLVVAPGVLNVVVVAWRGSVREPVLALLLAIAAVSLLAIRGLTELGSRAGQPWIRMAVMASFCLFSWVWVSPLLLARLKTAPPPSKAAIWIDDKIEPGAVVLVAEELMPHASALITKGRLVPIENAGPDRALAWYALIPGESTEPGAFVFSWPDSEPLRRLAGSRYRVVSVVPTDPRVPAP
ncbi:MAG: hypothetical protein NDJ92_03025 [Thermoanaerobaculia bacterium]|nr:hypothetical protein [Thermoanaerobaculia bacterium]